MSDLVRGKYPVSFSLVKLLGATNIAQPNIAARSNAEWLGLAGLTDSAAALTTAVATAVAIPVEYGDQISVIDILVGATAADTPLNQWAGLYAGIATPTLLGQSVDGTTTAIVASTLKSFALPAPIVITPANAPNGFVYVDLMVKATAVPSLVTVPVAAAAQYAWYAGMAAFLAAKHGSALTGTAPATIATPAAAAAAPVVFLR